MKLVPWRHQAPSKPATDLASWIDRFFEEPFGRFPEVFGGNQFPAVEVTEDEANYAVSFELPGLEEKEISVEVMRDHLRVSGERKMEEEKKDKKYHRVETQYGSFSRTIPLPSALRTDDAQAVYKKGILTVTFPKVEPTPSSKIEVKTG